MGTEMRSGPTERAICNPSICRDIWAGSNYRPRKTQPTSRITAFVIVLAIGMAESEQEKRQSLEDSPVCIVTRISC